MGREGKATVYIADSGKLCILSKLVDLIYDKVENNNILRTETIQGLSTPVVNEQIELDEEQERVPVGYC